MNMSFSCYLFVIQPDRSGGPKSLAASVTAMRARIDPPVQSWKSNVSLKRKMQRVGSDEVVGGLGEQSFRQEVGDPSPSVNGKE